MNKILSSKILLTFFSLMILIVFMSNSLGRGSIFGARISGAPGDSNQTCASSNCHSGGSFEPEGNITVLDAEGNEIDAFIPGETYDLTLSISTSQSASFYGFQMVALDKENNAVNNWSELGDNMQLVTLASRDYLEHNEPSESNEFTTKWTAPEVGSEEVTFYFSVNAVNGNGGRTGDSGSNSNFVLPEFTTSTSDAALDQINVYPTITSDWVTIEANQRAYKYVIYNTSGERIFASQFNRKGTLDLSTFEIGMYFLSIENGKSIITKKIIKI